jgi:L-threonylcarbamoyladenylate synthase
MSQAEGGLVAAHEPGAVMRCAKRLAQGQLVGIPTETVYGLAARADDNEAVDRIFSLKGRPRGHPLIVHVHSADDVGHFAQAVPEVAKRLMQHFWPGPLTLVFQRKQGAADAASAMQPTIAVRCPSHPVARELLSACQSLGVMGLAAPSANAFGRVSPTTAAHVLQEFGANRLMVLDAGPCDVGIESVIVDVSRERPVLLRPGAITLQALSQAAGQAVQSHDDMDNAPRASGTLEAHYAPKAKVRLMPAVALREALKVLGDALDEDPSKGGLKLAVYSRHGTTQGLSSKKRLVRREMPSQAQDAARELYATLRELDDAGATLIWVETPPDDASWDGVRDRLQRAAAAA